MGKKVGIWVGFSQFRLCYKIGDVSFFWKNKMKKESLNKATLKKVIAVSAVLALVIWIVADPAMAKITNEEIKEASKTWTSTIKDWSTPIMCGGMALAAIMFFINKYAYALGAIGGTGFMYAAKSFVGDGTGCTVDMAKSLLGIG